MENGKFKMENEFYLHLLSQDVFVRVENPVT